MNKVKVIRKMRKKLNKINQNKTEGNTKMKEATLNNNNNQMMKEVNNNMMNRVNNKMNEQSNKSPNVVQPILSEEEWARINTIIPDKMRLVWELQKWDMRKCYRKVYDFTSTMLPFQKGTDKKKCLCGSGMRFKKCCKPVLKRLQYLVNRIECKHIKPTDVVNAERIPYRVSWKNLPTEYREVCEKFVKDNPIVEGTCWYVSHHLASLHPDIKIVNGFYGGRIHDIHLEQFKRNMKKYNTHHMGGKIWDMGIRGTKNRLVYSTDKKVSWMKHSWNYIEGGADNGDDLYFDLVGEFFDVMNWQHTTEMREERKKEGKNGVMEDRLMKHTKDCVWTNFLATEKLDINTFRRSGWGKHLVQGCTENVWNYFMYQNDKPNHNPLWEGTDKGVFEKENNVDFDRIVELHYEPNFRKVA